MSMSRTSIRRFVLLLCLSLSDCVVIDHFSDLLRSVAFAQAGPTTFTVNSTGDEADSAPGDRVCKIEPFDTRSPTCTLRAAIQEANTTPATDTINFSIGSGIKTINVGSTGLGGLPAITSPIIIDGTSQPGFTGTPIIELNGASAGTGAGGNGLAIQGGSSTLKGLVLNRFAGAGIHIDSNGNSIESNYIGTDTTGTAALGNLSGIYIADVSDNLVGGTVSSARNIISGNRSGGVEIFGDRNVLRGNYIGMTAAGTIALSNSFSGVLIGPGATGNTIGGIITASRNVISGNGNNGIYILSANSNLVLGNFIGTNAVGTLALGNGADGVLIEGSASNTIGGTADGARNVISGNTGEGIEITGTSATGNKVQGNYIGTNPPGTARLSNHTGVLIKDAHDNVIGGTDNGSRNIISGNRFLGVQITGTGATGNTVQGNFIGTDATGTAALGNDNSGVDILDASDNLIGGTITTGRNVISGNLRGISFSGTPSGATGNRVLNNYIGTDVNGSGSLGNTNAGVSLYGRNNVIGSLNAGNVIAFNRVGIGSVNLDPSSTGNSIQFNSIYSNSELGIDLGSNGVTLNDPGDGDTGPNNLQNFPDLFSAITSPSGTTIRGSVSSIPSASFFVQLFANDSCDASGFGEGRVLLGDLIVGNGATFSEVVATIPSGQFVTATATRLDASGNPADTSEFSRCVQVVAPGSLQFSQANYSINENNSVAVISVARVGGSDGTVSVNYATSNGTAIAGADYTAHSGTLTFGNGDTFKTFTIPIINDSLDEPNETVNLTLSSPMGGATLGTPSTAVLTIVDDDVPPVIFIEEGTTLQAVALDSVTFVRGPFPILTDHNFSADHHTRVILFTSNLGLTQPDPSVLSVRAAGISLLVENVGPMTTPDGSYIVVRLPDGLPSGDLMLTVTLRGVTSSPAILSISP